MVQTNFGGVLTINGAPVGRELGRYYLKDELGPQSLNNEGLGRKNVPPAPAQTGADGSIVIVIATDAPLDARNLKRMGSRAIMGLARTGAAGSNGSGDYAIAFTTAADATPAAGSGSGPAANTRSLPNDLMSPLFLAVIEATEEAIYNSLFRAVTTTSNGHTVEALPVERTLEILRRHDAISLQP
ncbi:MAG TPA: P1 family peptidase [Pyrinomonadaceae bacterium]|nr:P1 family peptidase [Pyrinomonadaceae bacterium]